jgi:hypothetical protein
MNAHLHPCPCRRRYTTSCPSQRGKEASKGKMGHPLHFRKKVPAAYCDGRPTRLLARPARRSNRLFTSGSSSTSPAMSRLNRAGMTKPEKSRSGLTSSCGEWWAYQESSVANSQRLISQMRSDLSPLPAVMYRPSLDTERLRTSSVCSAAN